VKGERWAFKTWVIRILGPISEEFFEEIWLCKVNGIHNEICFTEEGKMDSSFVIVGINAYRDGRKLLGSFNKG
jgi:hypothetical protein